MFDGIKLARVPVARSRYIVSAKERRTARIFPANEAWPDHRLTAENGGSE